MTRIGRSIGDRVRWSNLRRVLFVLPIVMVLAGCRGRSDQVEAELRTRDAELRHLRTDLQRAEGLNYVLQSELQCRPAGVLMSGPDFSEAPAAPRASLAGMIKEVVLARGTGGVDEDGRPGDEAIMLVIVTKDADGSAVKVPGNLAVQAYEVTQEGIKLPLAGWDVPSLQLQKMWHSGLLSTGYHVKLAWKKPPSFEKIRIVCQFTTLPDNRLFEMDRDIVVRLIPGAGQPIPGMIVPGPAPTFDGPFLPPGALAPLPPAATVTANKPAEPERPRLLEPVVR